MTKPEIIKQTRDYIQKRMEGEGTGHDWWHVQRVVNSALTIGQAEGADLYVVELGALLHDIADWKFYDGDIEIGPRLAKEWLESLQADQVVVDEVEFIVCHLSFRGGKNITPMRTLEGKVVQDADRLDALGAIGISRAFAYGGSKARPLHDPYSPDETTIQHFYDKLLLVKDRMNTPTGRKLAENRHDYLEGFLKQFYAEWEGEA
jgi:uncharacterized protein